MMGLECSFFNWAQNWCAFIGATVYQAISYLSKPPFLFCRQLLQEVHDLLKRDRSPLCNYRPPAHGLELDPSVQRHLTHFSLLTHGFGAPALMAAISAIQSLINESLKTIDSKDDDKGVGSASSMSGKSAADKGDGPSGSSSGSAK